jgi:hypothetical protein
MTFSKMFYAVALIYCCIFSSSFGEVTFGEKGDKWISGSYSYHLISLGFDDVFFEGLADGAHILQLNSSYRYFVADQFFIGPQIGYFGAYGEDTDYITNFNFGATTGYVTQKIGPSSMYFTVGGNIDIVSFEEEMETGISWRPAWGTVIPIFDALAFQFELGINMMHVKGLQNNSISVNVGFAGFGNTTVVSLMNGALSRW